jgi:hypothetical protein
LKIDIKNILGGENIVILEIIPNNALTVINVFVVFTNED